MERIRVHSTRTKLMAVNGDTIIDIPLLKTIDWLVSASCVLCPVMIVAKDPSVSAVLAGREEIPAIKLAG